MVDTVNLFAPAVLNRVIADLRDAPQVGTFLVNRYFAEISQSMEEAIYFDVLTGKARLSPFVSPFVEGMIVETLGYTTNSFKPAYIKDKRVFEDAKSVRRRPGQPIAGALNPMQNRLLAIAQESEDQIRMVKRRMEWMAASALRTGKITVSGEKYPTTVVDFGRDAALTVTLTSGSFWDDVTGSPMEDLETWAGLIRTKSGARATDVIMAQNVWSVFRSNTDVKALLVAGRFSERTNIDIGPDAYPMFGATYKGTVGDFQFWVYADSYVDDANASQQYIPDDYVLLVSDQIQGVQHYGAIKDEQAGFQAVDYFQKSWTQPDPAVRYLMLQSAPLVVPYRVNASLSAKVML